MSGDIFTECAKEDELEQLSRKLATFSDPLLDLTGASPVPEEGYGLTAEAIDPKNNVATQSLFRKLNHHSLMVLQTTASGSTVNKEKEKNGKNGEVNERDPPTKKSRLRGMVEYGDLSEQQTRELPSLKIADSSKFSQGLIPAISKERGSVHSKLSHTEISKAMESNQREFEHWQPNLPGTLPSGMACHVLTEMSPGGSLMSTTSETSMQHLVSSSVQAEVKLQYNSLSELLRHFWSCFPIKTQFLEEKMVKMGQSLEKYRDVKLQQFRNQLPAEEAHLANHLVEMLDTALTKYRTWLEKKSGAKISSS